MEEKLYSASLLFKSYVSDDTSVPHLWEDVIVVVKSISESEAKEAFFNFAREYETTYIASAGNLTSWVFDSIERVIECDDIVKDDINKPLEIFSRFLSDQEVALLKRPLF